MKSWKFFFVLMALQIHPAVQCTNPPSARLVQQQQNFDSVFISESRISRLRDRIDNKIEPTWSAFQSLRKYADKSIGRKSHVQSRWHVPEFYVDARGHKRAKDGLRDDANTAYALALCFRMTGNAVYGREAVRLIMAWATGLKIMSRKADSSLSFSYHFPAMIFAADLMRHSPIWTEDMEKRFSLFLKTKAIPMNTMEKGNNWGNWGLVLAMACAVYLEDQPLFDECIVRWKYFIEHQIDDDGNLTHEVKRSKGKMGLWYTHFCLMPQTLAAEIAFVNGIDLYDYVSPAGHTLQDAYYRIAGWTQHPESFPFWKGNPRELGGADYFSYYEILNTIWRTDRVSILLERHRPMSADHSAPFMTFTHGVF
jgi:hypothetical protein